ncbi:MAX gene-associated protein, partial [Varanus komodoensis]
QEILDDNTIEEREELQNVQASLLTTCDSDCQISLQLLERKLLEDLKSFRHKQVIHPSLQEVGLKLGSVDPTLSIDLKYLGVQLPLRSSRDYVFENNQGTNSTCQDARHFISRTGKTNDFRKIKGWQGRFHSASRQEGSILTNSFKNRSAFCSDKLDEYLESERKLMETDVEFSSNSLSYPVAYQLPSKSTSCVQVLNSVLKKKSVSPPSAHTFNPLSLPSTFRKRKIKTKSKQGTKGRVKSSDKFAVPSYVLSKQKHNYSFKLLEQKQSNDIIGLSKTQLQLMELEDCALRDGKPRTYVTEERASSSLDTLLISQVQVELMELEDSALQNGKPQNYITKERADLSLAALLIPQPPLKSKPIYDLIGSQELQYNNTFCNVEDVCADLAFEKCQPTCPSKTVGTSDCLKRRISVLKGASMPKQHLKRSLCEILTNCKDQEEKEMAWVNNHSRCNVKSIYSAEMDQPIEDFPIMLKEESEIDVKTVYLPSLSATKPTQHMMQPYSEVVLPFKSACSGIKRDQLRMPKFNPVVKQIQQEHKYAVPSHFEKMWSYACTSKYKDSIGKKKQQHGIKQTPSSEKCIGEDHISDVPEEPCGIESYSGESDVGIPSARTCMFPEKSASHSSSTLVCPARKLASETLRSKLISTISETQATTILPAEPVSESQAVDLSLKLYPASIVHSTTNSVPLQSGRIALPNHPGQEAVSHANFHNILSLQIASNSFSISVQEELDTMRPEEEIELHSEE